MSLNQKQWLFTVNIAHLILWAASQGFMLSFGRAFASAAANAADGGISNSLHLRRLAIDLNLFVGGKYQTDSEAYRSLGEKWKSLHPLNCWGGDFPKPDGNHFSMEHEGIR